MSLLVSEMKKMNFIFKSHDFPISEIFKWILSVSLNIRHLEIRLLEHSNGMHNEIGRLKKLKELHVLTFKASELKEVT
jgi:hypothetical protein